MLESILAGLFGLLIGSFLNVCIYRLPRDLSVVAPRSFCPGCERPISWFDNIPVLSYLMLGRRCRSCQMSISWRYPAVELLTGILFALGVAVLGPTLGALKFCVFAAIQVALIFTDFEERILPDEFTLGGTVAGLIFAWFVPLGGGIFSLFMSEDTSPRVISVVEAATAAGLLSSCLWVVGVLYAKVRHREGLGFGDVKMVATIGSFLGFEGSLHTMVAGTLLGLFSGLLYIVFTRKDAASYELPFGSFLGIAALGVAIMRLTFTRAGL